MRLSSRPPLRRIMGIDQAVRSGGWPNATTLAAEFEVDPKTVRRDIAYLRDQLHAPLEYDPARFGYFYREPSFRLPFFQLTEGELVAVLLAERVLKQYRGTPFEADLRRAFAKVTELLPETISTIDKAVQKGVLHRNAAARYKSRLTVRANAGGTK